MKRRTRRIIIFTVLVVIFLVLFTLTLICVGIYKAFPAEATITKFILQQLETSFNAQADVRKVRFVLYPTKIEIEELQILIPGEIDSLLTIKRCELPFDWVYYLTHKKIKFKSIELHDPWLFVQKKTAGINYFSGEQVRKILSAIPDRYPAINIHNGKVEFINHLHQNDIVITDLDLEIGFHKGESVGVILMDIEMKKGNAKMRNGVEFPIGGHFICELAEEEGMVKLADSTFKIDDMEFLISGGFFHLETHPIYYLKANGTDIPMTQYMKNFYSDSPLTKLTKGGKAIIKLNFQGEFNEAPAMIGQINWEGFLLEGAELPTPITIKGDIIFHDPKIEYRNVKIFSTHSSALFNAWKPDWHSPTFDITIESDYALVEELPVSLGRFWHERNALRGEIRIKELNLINYPLTDVRIKFHNTLPAVFDIEELTASGMGGVWTAQGLLDLTSPKDSNINLKVNLQDIDLDKLFPARTQQLVAHYKGNLNAQLSWFWKLNQWPASLVGKSSIDLRNGSLRNTPLQTGIGKFLNSDALGTISFDSILADLDIKDKKINIKRFTLNSPNLIAAVDGWYGVEGKSDLFIRLGFRNELLRILRYNVPKPNIQNGILPAELYLTGTMDNPGISWSRQADKVSSR